MSWLRFSLAAIVCVGITMCLSGCFLPRFVPTDENVVGTWMVDAESSMGYVLNEWGGAEGQLVVNADHTFDMVGVPGAIFSSEKLADVSERSGEWEITGEGRSAELVLVATSYPSDGDERQASPRLDVSDGQLMMIFNVTEDLPNALIFTRKR